MFDACHSENFCPPARSTEISSELNDTTLLIVSGYWDLVFAKYPNGTFVVWNRHNGCGPFSQLQFTEDTLRHMAVNGLEKVCLTISLHSYL